MRSGGILAAAACLLAPVVPLAQEGGEPAPRIVCSVAGYDVLIENLGGTPVAAGTEIHWSVPFARRDGVHRFDEPLEPGGRVFLSTALGATFLDPGRPCEVTPG